MRGPRPSAREGGHQVSVTAPLGFRAAGVAAGITRSGSRDVAVVLHARPSRAAAGVLAEQRMGVTQRMHLLDDGLQHRRLARDVDIVVLHRSDFATTLLPAGRLREPLVALARADMVVLRREDAAVEERARRWMRRRQ